MIINIKVIFIAEIKNINIFAKYVNLHIKWNR